MDVLGEIHEYSTAEFLARNDGFSLGAFQPYVDLARAAISGAATELDESIVTRVKLHRLLLEDKDEEFLDSNPELKPDFVSSDAHQIAMTSSPLNLDHFTDAGISYEFNTEKLDYARSIASSGTGLAMKALMREKIMTLSGFEDVSINFIFHDVLDHAWLFNFMRAHQLDKKYADFIVAIGNPFKGHLMSRESELLSGIGFTSRRYLSDEDYYGNIGMNPEALAALLGSKDLDKDPRVHGAVELVNKDESISTWAGFVVKATLSNLILQRERWGGVKRLVTLENGSFKSTGEIISLTDPRYIALIIDTVRLLALNRDDYVKQELSLNQAVEEIVQKFLAGGFSAGSIAVAQNVSLDAQNPAGEYGLSTHHFRNRDAS